jgi:hypothetical protein
MTIQVSFRRTQVNEYFPSLFFAGSSRILSLLHRQRPSSIFLGVIRTSKMKQEHKRQTSISGTVTSVFVHRFVVDSGDSEFQADIGRERVGLVGLQEGDW